MNLRTSEKPLAGCWPTTYEIFNNFRYEFHLKNTFPITDFFFPEIGFARNSKIYGNYNPAIYEFNLEGDLPNFQYGETKWDNLEISLVSNDTSAYFLTTCGSMVSGSVLNMENIRLSWNVDRDSLNYSLLWKNKDLEDISLGDISGYASFMYRPDYQIAPHQWSFINSRSVTTHNLLPSMVNSQDVPRMNCISILRTWTWNT
jgi:hypothetical protein